MNQQGNICSTQRLLALLMIIMNVQQVVEGSWAQQLASRVHRNIFDHPEGPVIAQASTLASVLCTNYNMLLGAYFVGTDYWRQQSPKMQVCIVAGTALNAIYNECTFKKLRPQEGRCVKSTPGFPSVIQGCDYSFFGAFIRNYANSFMGCFVHYYAMKKIYARCTRHVQPKRATWKEAADTFNSYGLKMCARQVALSAANFLIVSKVLQFDFPARIVTPALSLYKQYPGRTLGAIALGGLCYAALRPAQAEDELDDES